MGKHPVIYGFIGVYQIECVIICTNRTVILRINDIKCNIAQRLVLIMKPNAMYFSYLIARTE